MDIVQGNDDHHKLLGNISCCSGSSQYHLNSPEDKFQILHLLFRQDIHHQWKLTENDREWEIKIQQK